MTRPGGDGGAGPSDGGSLVPIRPAGRRPPLFCVHPVSGSPYVYAGLARLLEEEQPVYGFEAPGYDDDRKPLTSFDALAAEYLPALRRARPDGPYRLLGWSLGGSLAFYLAQQLVAAGAAVPVLVLVDATVPFRSPLPAEREMLRKFLHDLLALGGLPAAGLAEIVAGLPADVPPERFFAAVERGGLLPEDADADFLDYRYSVFRAHIGALYDFEPAGGYAGPVTVIRASGTDPAYMHWERVAGRVTAYTVPGDHHSIWSGAGLLDLARIVRQTLATDGQ